MAVAAPRSVPLAADTALAGRYRCTSSPVPRVALSAGPAGASSRRLISRRSRICLAAARAISAAAPADGATRLCGENAQGREPESSARASVALPGGRAAGAHDDDGSEGAQPLSSAAPLLPPASFAAFLSLALPPSAIALTFSALTPPAVAASLLPPLPAPLAASAVAALPLPALPLPALPLAALDLSAAWDAVDDALFAAAHLSDRLVSLELASLSPASVAVLFAAGVATSLTPCTLSVLPLTVGYIAGFQSAKPRALIAADAACFALGLAATRAAMGVAAALAGRAYGQAAGGGAGDAVAGVLPVVAGGVAVAMGLNLLGLLPLRLPSAFGGFDAKQAAARLPSAVQMLLAGAAFAFVASPCATPVLASLLAYVATTGVSAAMEGWMDVTTAPSHHLYSCFPPAASQTCAQHHRGARLLRSTAFIPPCPWTGPLCLTPATVPLTSPPLHAIPPMPWQDAVLGGALLLVYTLGFVSPLMLAAAFTGALKRLLALRQHALWINPASGALLLASGTYALLDHTFPDASSLPFTSL
ncbi:unnamed protein product [Closterium sp. Yama58-4]|nr:unnamed protein product [Closterium sp. Yama58-4]